MEKEEGLNYIKKVIKGEISIVKMNMGIALLTWL